MSASSGISRRQLTCFLWPSATTPQPVSTMRTDQRPSENSLIWNLPDRTWSACWSWIPTTRRWDLHLTLRITDLFSIIPSQVQFKQDSVSWSFISILFCMCPCVCVCSCLLWLCICSQAAAYLRFCPVQKDKQSEFSWWTTSRPAAHPLINKGNRTDRVQPNVT